MHFNGNFLFSFVVGKQHFKRQMEKGGEVNKMYEDVQLRMHIELSFWRKEGCQLEGCMRRAVRRMHLCESRLLSANWHCIEWDLKFCNREGIRSKVILGL